MEFPRILMFTRTADEIIIVLQVLSLRSWCFAHIVRLTTLLSTQRVTSEVIISNITVTSIPSSNTSTFHTRLSCYTSLLAYNTFINSGDSRMERNCLKRFQFLNYWTLFKCVYRHITKIYLLTIWGYAINHWLTA